jgi:predicted nucleotidyltransferase
MDMKTNKLKTPKNVTKESKLSQLNKGLLIANVQKEMKEPGYTPINRITRNRKVVQRRQEYCADIERVINEAELTTALLSETKDGKTINGKVYQPEEIINYYNGIFLDQVHQIRDKLFRMVSLQLLDLGTAQDNQKKDPKKMEYKKFVDKNKEQLSKIGIYEPLTKWYLEGSGIKVAIDKRTQHHHRVSTLKLNSDYQKITMSRLMLNPAASDQLSEYGKKKMSEIGEETFTKWRKEVISKQKNTIEEVIHNVEIISERLSKYFKIPPSPKKVVEIFNEYNKFLASMKIKKEANISKISSDIKPLIDGAVEIAKTEFGDKLHSAYLVGSCARNEFIPGSSDINMYFIFNNEGNFAFSRNEFPLLNAIFISKKAFLSKEHKKDRFICWSDGILLYGEEIKFDPKEFPKAGTLLTLLLNRGFIEKLEKIKKEVNNLKNPDAKKMRPYSLKAVKIIMDWDFGVAMANKPFYTASRLGKIKYTKESWPNEPRTITLEQLYKDNASVRQKDFPMLIDTFMTNAKPNYQKVLEVEKEILKVKYPK